MKKAMADFTDSIQHSRVHESQCSLWASSDPSLGKIPSGGSEFQVSRGRAVPGQCLTIQWLEKHAVVVTGSCDSGSKWDEMSDGRLVNLADAEMCLKLDHPSSLCAERNTI